MDLGLEGRVAIVCGSSEGIGLAIAESLADAVRPGVVGWMKTLAREVGPSGITVNMIATGRVDTARIREVYPDGPTEEDLKSIPLRRLVTTRELGDVVTFLASDRAAYIT